jgi:hypothetical protein
MKITPPNENNALQANLFHILQIVTDYSMTMPTAVRSAVMAYTPSSKEPTVTAVPRVRATAAPDELVEDADEPDESAVPVGLEVTVPVPAVPASFMRELQVPVALVAEVTVADPPKLHAEDAELCSE